MDALPIDAQLPAALAALDTAGALVLTAPPGSGKSTRLPPALVGRRPGQVYLLQPRRVAARSLARRIASERGWTLGEEIGWRVRHERIGGARTRLWVMTEGSLTRQLQADPYLEGVAAVVLDEFHERSLHTDLCLAWIAELRRTVRADLALVVMSATMDPVPVACFLGGCPTVAVATPTHPVTQRVGVGREGARIEEQVREAVAEAVRDADCGDILVFLPGVGEIEGCRGALAALSRDHDLAVLPLHGSLPPDEQDAALAPSPRRKVVLATNVAETSLTIPGVRTVIDSGLARVMRFAPDTGLDELRLEPISRASADQRAGRAGRTAPGRCWRLWSRLQDHRLKPANDPEIARVDLAPTLLALKAWHGADPRTFPWFDRPEDARLAHGEELLAMLGACPEPYAAVTALGKRMARLPTHPRLARLLIDAAAAGRLRLGASLAALVGERDIRPPRRGAAPSAPGDADALDRLDALAEAERVRFRPELRDRGIDPIAAREAARVRDELIGLWRDAGEKAEAGADAGDARAVARLLLAAYPERVAKRAAPTANRVAMVGGVGMEIEPASCLYAQPGRPRDELLLAVAVQGLAHGGKSSTRVRQASVIEEADIEAVFPGALARREIVVYDAARGAVTAMAGWYYRDLAIRMAPGASVDPARISACLAEALRPQARALVVADADAASFLARLEWLRRARSDLALPTIGDADLAELIDALCAGCRSRAEVEAKPKLDWLRGRLPFAQAHQIDELAPSHLAVPSGSRIALAYDDPDRPPVLAVRLQELFGLPETPRLAGGRVPVLLHLLGPNFRPEQITQDLASFWRNTYPQVRKDLRARYPKHSWPEDPLTAVPEAKGKRRN